MEMLESIRQITFLYEIMFVKLYNIASHYENMPIQIHWKFYHQKMVFFQLKNSDIFVISAQNIDCGYS